MLQLQEGRYKEIICRRIIKKQLPKRKLAKERYLNALSASIQGTASVFLKRKVKDIFVNAYNKKIMAIFQANHDLQICIDQYSCAQYICGYLTKNEAGLSKLLKAVNEETTNLNQIGRLNALAAVLDKHREVSIQEAIYRLLGLSMTKSSVIVKYLSTVHPHFRDGLLKGNMENLDDTESIFHNSPHEYYENRPDESLDLEKIEYDSEELADKTKEITKEGITASEEVIHILQANPDASVHLILSYYYWIRKISRQSELLFIHLKNTPTVNPFY